MNRWRSLGLPTAAAVLLAAGVVRLWEAGGGLGAGGALLGTGLLMLGIAVRDWIDHHTHDDDEGGDRHG